MSRWEEAGGEGVKGEYDGELREERGGVERSRGVEGGGERRGGVEGGGERRGGEERGVEGWKGEERVEGEGMLGS